MLIETGATLTARQRMLYENIVLIRMYANSPPCYLVSSTPRLVGFT